MKENKRKLLKDIVFCLWLGFEVIGVFLLAVIAGLWLDDYFNSKPCWILVLLIVPLNLRKACDISLACNPT